MSTAVVTRFSWHPGPFVRTCMVPEAAGERHTKKVYEDHSILNPLNRLLVIWLRVQPGVNIFSLFSEDGCKAAGHHKRSRLISDCLTAFGLSL